MGKIKTKVTVERIGIVRDEQRALLRVCNDVFLDGCFSDDGEKRKVPVGFSGKKIKKLKEWNNVKILNDRLFPYLFKAYEQGKEVIVHLEKRKDGLYVIGLEFC
ncbi:hypothetical protein [Anoxybacillus sp. MB8]|uniref:hypothetical protein n=1 Tax=Anoxybacillus sp. MB8 TaxID=2496850 RepID=UPI0013D63F88|nr:hypothetical protein [Anoxybacillus sp. MB8]